MRDPLPLIAGLGPDSMQPSTQRLEHLIAADELETALAELAEAAAAADDDLRAETIAHRARLAQAARDERRGLIDAEHAGQVRNRVRYALLDLLREWRERRPAPAGPGGPAAGTAALPATPPDAVAASRQPSVFISHSRTDAEVVARLRSALADQGIRVRIDVLDLQAGEDIESFIRRAIAESDLILSIVSRRSLLSPWVGMETVLGLYGEALLGGRRLIAGYLDPDFLDLGFRLTATGEIDARIAEIETLAAAYADKHLDGGDLVRHKARLFALRNNLGAILDRLRNALCLDLREPAWETSLARIIAAVMHGRNQPHAPA